MLGCLGVFGSILAGAFLIVNLVFAGLHRVVDIFRAFVALLALSLGIGAVASQVALDVVVIVIAEHLDVVRELALKYPV